MYKNCKKLEILKWPRKLSCLIYKLQLNTWKTKFCKDVKCICGQLISIHHIIYGCEKLNELYRINNIEIDRTDITNVLNSQSIHKIAFIILGTELGNIL